MWGKIVQLLAIPVVASALAPPAGARLRFGIDPQPAGTAGAIQSPVVAVDQTKTLTALRALRPASSSCCGSTACSSQAGPGGAGRGATPAPTGQISSPAVDVGASN